MSKDMQSLIQVGIETVTKATQHDRAGLYAEAVQYYDSALDYFRRAFAVETNESNRMLLSTKVQEYETRSNKLKDILGAPITPRTVLSTSPPRSLHSSSSSGSLNSNPSTPTSIPTSIPTFQSNLVGNSGSIIASVSPPHDRLVKHPPPLLSTLHNNNQPLSISHGDLTTADQESPIPLREASHSDPSGKRNKLKNLISLGVGKPKVGVHSSGGSSTNLFRSGSNSNLINQIVSSAVDLMRQAETEADPKAAMVLYKNASDALLKATKLSAEAQEEN